MEKELLSVIVPVYNTEKYVGKCIESVLGQTYRNIELLLIDDGSTDKSGEICDKYAALDSRARVFHKKHMGVSAARNFGLEIAEGEYVGFVDSDDHILPQMYEILIGSLNENNADISVCARTECEEGASVNSEPGENSVLVLNPREAIRDLFVSNRYIYHSMWDKLCRRSLLDGLEFPEARLYEDGAVTLRLIERSSKIAVTTARLYCYVKRQGSLTVGGFDRDRAYAWMERRIDAINYFEKKEDEEGRLYATAWLMRIVYPVWCELYENDRPSADYAVKMFKKYFSRKALKLLPLKQRIKLILFRVNPGIVRLIAGSQRAR